MKTNTNKARTSGSAKFSNRGDQIRGLMRKLEWDGYPRLQMSLFIIITGASGMVVSYMLLLSGVNSMFVRYPLSVVCAYLVFILLLWLWLRTKSDDYLDLAPDIATSGSGGSSADLESSSNISGGGGQFGGGGASDSYILDDTLPSPSLPNIDIPFGESVGEAISGADEIALPLVVALLIAAVAASLLFASLYIVYLAPFFCGTAGGWCVVRKLVSSYERFTNPPLAGKCATSNCRSFCRDSYHIVCNWIWFSFVCTSGAYTWRGDAALSFSEIVGPIGNRTLVSKHGHVCRVRYWSCSIFHQ